jgi:osmotically-inducible protein OsmY
MSDTETALHAAVMEALADNPRVRADEIVGDSGRIVLRGTVGGLVQQAEAVRTASGVPGVRHVDDDLDVRLMGIDGRADADTEAAVLDALAADEEINAGDIDVEVKEGAVTLGGSSRLSRSAIAPSGSPSPSQASRASTTRCASG